MAQSSESYVKTDESLCAQTAVTSPHPIARIRPIIAPKLRRVWDRLFGFSPKLPLSSLDLRCGNDGLRSAFNTQFLENRRNMGLNGGFRDRQFIGDLLVEKAF